jgi:CO/xanthine dehydrogenase FAD-binding subunit
VTLADGAVHSTNGSLKLAELVASEAGGTGVLTYETSFVDNSIEMMASGKDAANLSPSYAFAAHVARVHVEPLIGRVTLLDYVAAHDLGRPINPSLAEGQIVGGAVMGIGGALGEELLLDHGRVVNGAYVNYALPRAGDVPTIRPIIVDVDEATGPYGAKSVGEMSLIPAAPAIANAVADATGVRISDLPITPDKIINALARPADLHRRYAIWRRPSRWWIATMRWLYRHGLHGALERVRDTLGAGVKPAYQIGEAVPIASLQDALDALQSGARPLGGGTDLVPAARQGIGSPAPLIPLVGLAALRRIEMNEKHWVFGAAVTLSELAEAVRSELPGLAEAVESIATPQVRNVATVAGNLVQEKRCWFFRNGFACYKRSGSSAPCYAINGDHRFYHAAMDAHRCQAVTPSDLATVFAALDSEVHVVSGRSSRWIPISEFYTGPGETRLATTDLVTAVRFPSPRAGAQLVFEKLNLYQGDFAVVAMAVRLGRWEGESTHDPRCLLGAVAPVPVRLTDVERAIARGATPEQCREAAHRELDRRGHPLPRNGWKLLAAAGMAELLARRLANDPES